MPPKTRSAQLPNATAIAEVAKVAKVAKDKAAKVKVAKVKVTKVKAESINGEQVSKSKRPPKVKAIFEDSLNHNPVSLNLPPDFVNYHTPEFISGCEHIIKVDPTLYPAIVHSNFTGFQNVPCAELSDSELIRSYWLALISSVISQQVSGAAANSIKGKFLALLGDEITPQKTLTKSVEELRSAGLSGQKVKYVTHISEVYADESSKLLDPAFYKSGDEELLAELVSLKGIGLWSAKMFITFTLKDFDVFAHDDLGVARGISRYLQKRPQLLESIKQETNGNELLKKRSSFDKKSKRDWTPYHDVYVRHAAERFRPYRSVFMLLCWRLSETNVGALEKNEVKEETGA